MLGRLSGRAVGVIDTCYQATGCNSWPGQYSVSVKKMLCRYLLLDVTVCSGMEC